MSMPGSPAKSNSRGSEEAGVDFTGPDPAIYHDASCCTELCTSLTPIVLSLWSCARHVNEPYCLNLPDAGAEADEVVTHKEKNRVAQKRFRQRQKVRSTRICATASRAKRGPR